MTTLQSVVPSVASAMQLCLATQSTAIMAAAPVGTWPSVQLVPPSVVLITAAVAPAEPTATQESLEKHEMAASTFTDAGTVWAFQLVPPLRVATIAAVTPLPNPTDQQWSTSPQDTAVALVMASGAG